MKPYTWRAAILKSTLPPTTRHVLLTLSCYINDVGQSAYPSVKRLVVDTGLSERAVVKHLGEAKAAGWLSVKKHGFGGQNWANNEYMPHIPEQDPYTVPPDEEILHEPTEQTRARKAVANALLSGKLVKMPCACCNDLNTEAHHPDYSKPLVVVWLCRRCHADTHQLEKKRDAPDALASNVMHDVHVPDAPGSERDAPRASEVMHDVHSNSPSELSNELSKEKPAVDAKLSKKDLRENALFVLDYLNAKANRDYMPVDSNLNFILARFKEGATVDNCKAVVDLKVAEWGRKTEMLTYLRPETLFGGKFFGYLGSVKATAQIAAAANQPRQTSRNAHSGGAAAIFGADFGAPALSLQPSREMKDVN